MTNRKQNDTLKGNHGWGQGGERTQALYAHMNNKRKKKINKGNHMAKSTHSIYKA
jgi:hypothetical protein